MPPPHRFLAPRLRGYVCRACLSKSRVIPQQQPSWLLRNATNGRGPPQVNGGTTQDDLPEPEIREFEQTANGVRKEIRDDVLERIEKEIRMIEKEEGKSIEELVGPVDLESFLKNDGEQRPYDPIMGDSIAAITKRTEELEAFNERVETISDYSTLSVEDRTKLREELLNTLTIKESPLIQAQANADGAPHAPESRSNSTDVSTKHAKYSIGIPVELFAKEHHYHLEAFNGVLNQALRNSSGKRPRRPGASSQRRPTSKDIYKAYLLCRNAIRSAPHLVPQRVWEVLWGMFEKESANNFDRMSHIKSLGEDTAFPLSPSQRLLYIESIFIAGDASIALREWNAAQYLQDEVHFKEYWELGVRMLCQVGEVERATQAAGRFLQGSQDRSHFRILLPIIQATLNSKDRSSLQNAWALYIRLRVNLGPQMTMGDYDAVTAMFLKANQPDLALGAFKDMMLTGSESAVKQDSTAMYRDYVGVDDLGSIQIQQRELDWENSGIFATLPAQFRNKFFFGSWIKKLIGEGELDAAKKVFDLMQVLRIRPDSKHMNGLIGAWFRQGIERSRVLAEDMAWKMIQARLDFVKVRDVQYRLQGPIRVVDTNDLPDNKSVCFLVPSATIETFAILIEQYRRRQKPQLLSDLFDALRNAKVKPNTFFMNELLLSDTKSHHTRWAWDTYYSLTNETGVRPDLDTYKILWNLMKRAMDPVRKLDSDKQPFAFTTCRRMFADMVKRQKLLTSKESLPREVYDLIILSFSLATDQAGTAVALRALQRHFGLYPNEETARTVVMQLARCGLVDEFGNKPKRLRSPVTKERIANVTRILEMFKDQRIEVLAEQGIAYDRLRGDARSEESLLLLSDLLRYVAKARIAAEERFSYNTATASEIAAQQMGVPDCVPWVAHGKGEAEEVM